MYADNSWLSWDPIYLSLLHPNKFSDNFSDMDGFQDGGYIWAQGVLQYNLVKAKTKIIIKKCTKPIVEFHSKIKRNGNSLDWLTEWLNNWVKDLMIMKCFTLQNHLVYIEDFRQVGGGVRDVMVKPRKNIRI